MKLGEDLACEHVLCQRRLRPPNRLRQRTDDETKSIYMSKEFQQISNAHRAAQAAKARSRRSRIRHKMRETPGLCRSPLARAEPRPRQASQKTRKKLGPIRQAARDRSPSARRLIRRQDFEFDGAVSLRHGRLSELRKLDPKNGRHLRGDEFKDSDPAVVREAASKPRSRPIAATRSCTTPMRARERDPRGRGPPRSGDRAITRTSASRLSAPYFKFEAAAHPDQVWCRATRHSRRDALFIARPA